MIRDAIVAIGIALSWMIAASLGYEDGRNYQRALDCQWSGGTMNDGVCWASEKAGDGK